MATSNTNGLWYVVSVVLGIACIPFVAAWFWLMLTIPHAPLHPVPPDHMIPMLVGRHGPYTVYVTPLQSELSKLGVVLTGTFLFIGFSIALTIANRGRIRVLARVHMIATKDGGRVEPLTTGYRSNSSFGAASRLTSCIGRFEVSEDRWIYPGETAEIVVSFRSTTALAKVLQAGRKWTIHEGGKLVGYGEVITLLTMASFDANQGRW
jgi:hypothetical protein